MGQTLEQSPPNEPQTLEQSPPNKPPQSTIYSMIGPHSGPSTSAGTSEKPPESLYTSVDKP